MTIYLRALAHLLTWTARHTTDPDLATTLNETSWDIKDAQARRRQEQQRRG